MKRIAVLVSFLLFCSPLYAADVKAGENPIVRLSVLASGKVLLDGKESNLLEIKKALEKIKLENGVVWYYRENAKGMPPPEAMDVLNLVIENNLPIRMSSKPDFSDYIDDEGGSHPRK